VKKIFGLTVAALMVIALVGGGTWADLNSDGLIDGGVWSDTNTNGYMDIGEGEKMYEGDLDSMTATYPASGKIDLDGSGSIDVYFDASVATTVLNGIMGDSSTFDITFQLDQTTS